MVRSLIKPRADLTISRFFDPRKTAVVAMSSLSVSSEISSARELGSGQDIKMHIPLNSKISRDNALILAEIMWGVVPVRPAATIVMNSSTFASTSPVSSDHHLPW